MATFRAAQVSCEAVIRLLREAYRPDLIEVQLPLSFEVYSTEKFKNHMPSGISLFLYRVYVNGSQRAAAGHSLPGQRTRPPLPLDLHFFLTVWAGDASLQHTLLGWMMRTLEDYPTLPAALLNGVRPGVFQAHETVELVPGQLTNEELMRIWDDLQTEYQLSVPYVARVVRIESLLTSETGAPVRRTDLDFGRWE